MSLPPDAAPPGHLPAAATPPWPLQPPPHGAAVATIPVKPREEHGLSTLAVALIGGATAAAIGLAIAIPLLRRPAKPAPRRAGSAKPRAKRKPTS